MCGIAGIVGSKDDHTIDYAAVRRMCDSMVHRGPDEEGIFVRDGAGLGMRRLSIIDLAGGHQPIFNEDRSAWIVFNGEIYNFPDLRPELESCGHKFSTDSDTETILHLYEDLGADCVQKLRGMFAFALFDERRRSLLLARDRLGKKPLHYALHKGRLYFGSEIKAILTAAPELADVDRQALLQYMYLGYIPGPATAFTSIRKLPPGHLLQFQSGNLQMRQYWDVPRYDTHVPRSEQECLEELEYRLAEAVRIRLISDVPLGALLSGGTDSSTVVALMARASSKPVKTFSIGFKHADFNESHYARMVAEKFGTEHQELILDPDVVGTVEKLTRSLEEPFGDSSMLPTYYVSCLARQHVTVALSGDGGDELFAGYDRYRIQERRRIFEHVPAALWRQYREHVFPLLPRNITGRKFSYSVSLPWKERYADSMCFMPALERDVPLLSPEFSALARNGADPQQILLQYFDQAPATDPISQMLYVDMKTYLVEDILTKVDRMSMLTSLEVRVPILDHLFVEWVAALPVEYKLRGGKQKYILRQLAERVGIPAEVIYRRKQGFALPLKHWMRNELKDLIQTALLEPRTLQRGFFDPRGVRHLMDEHFSGRRDYSGQIWQLLMFELWHRNFLETLKQTGTPTDSVQLTAILSKAPTSPAITASATRQTSEGSHGVFLMINSFETGGTERQFAALAQGLDRHDFQLHLGCIQEKGALRALFADVPRFGLGGSLYGIQSWRSRARLSRHLKDNHIKIAHAFDFYTNLTLIPAARLAGVPVVIGSLRQIGDLLSPAKRRAQNAVFRLCDIVVCNSRAAASQLARHGFPERKIAVIGNALHPEAFAEAIPALPRTAGTPRVGMIARMNAEYKNHDLFLRAAAYVLSQVPHAEFILAGDGPLRSVFENQAATLGIAHRVRFLGDCTDVSGLLASLDVSVNASSSESLSNVILESMAAGVAVVATDVGGNSELISTDTGVLVPHLAEKPLADAIIQLLRDSGLRAKLGQNARQFARDNFALEKISREYKSLYIALLDRRRAHDASPFGAASQWPTIAPLGSDRGADAEVGGRPGGSG